MRRLAAEPEIEHTSQEVRASFQTCPTRAQTLACEGGASDVGGGRYTVAGAGAQEHSEANLLGGSFRRAQYALVRSQTDVVDSESL